ncbi:deoxyribonuclease IV [Mycoplasma zalophidermidis]|uniref:Probable endonuclease 4 n=1 Tax=Mycoplasma zalophidermidis TaxID=398174 RepID=A0ABS6DSA1_9MOLU|nr:deoxyribonuclease IV [Mycoplasma zalophidermidis]MBU4689702.1 deoxyribonuclease IV [Mycoplasma zalophidermidis]MBU4693902.1 deoxyribonuclease IV [Mycoplasma zalophidermidis]MCR8966666.1 deoxyribonuclease IV [Mycoplasma zalophidermidis]
MIKLGSHVQFKAPNYLVDSAETSINNGANCMMIYVGPPQSTKRISNEKYKLDEYIKQYSNIIKPEDVVVHAPYIINMASPEKGDFAVQFLIEEIKRVDYIGAKYLVLHPGAHTTFDVDFSIQTLCNNLQKVIDATKNVIICLETMSGKGTEVCKNFEQIKYVINKLNNERIQLCLDTCHIWDAGYNIKNYEDFKSELVKFDLLKHIKVIHLNDSLNGLNSHKDRHANIDKGHIGLQTLSRFVHDKDFDNIPIILETPWTDNGPIYDVEIKMLLDAK